MTPRLREKALALRKAQHLPWHSPPHYHSDRTDHYLFTAACYEHRPVIGANAMRLAQFEHELLVAAKERCRRIFGWVVLPNHYHFLAECDDARETIAALGRLHGTTSFR